MKPYLKFLVLVFGLALPVKAQVNVQLPTIPANTFYATNYGAVGDGVSTNTTAIQNAINAAGTAGGGTVVVTPGNYLCGPLTLKNSLHLKLLTNATLTLLPIDKYPGYTNNPVAFITASSLHDLMVSGGGGIEGQGLPWWQATATNADDITRPVIFNFSACSKILLQDITLSNSPSPFVVVKGSKAGNVTLQRVGIFAPSSGFIPSTLASHNTDALDLAETNAIIRDCVFSTGDDNIAIGSSGSASYGILVSNCVFGAGHGVSIGSFTSGDVSNLTVVNCSFNGTDNGIRLKSQRGRGGIVQNLYYANLTMTNVPWPFFIYSYYELGLGTITGVNPVFAANYAFTDSNTNTANYPEWRNITFSNIVANTGASTRPPLVIWGLTNYPASNIVFQKVTLISSSTLSPGIYNATNIQFLDCTWSLSSTATNLQFWNAQAIISNSASVASLVKLDGLTTNGYGNAVKVYRANTALRDTNTFAGGPLLLSGSTFNVTNHLAPLHATAFNFVLGTNAATIAVRSNLVFDGTFAFTAGSGFTNGSYTLFTYGGALAMAAATNASSPSGYNYAFDTNTAGQVKLTVTLPSPPSLNSVSVAGTNLVVSGSSGYSNGSYNYCVLASTNVALPMSNWTRLATNTFSANGNFGFSNGISTNLPLRFFRVMIP